MDSEAKDCYGHTDTNSENSMESFCEVPIGVSGTYSVDHFARSGTELDTERHVSSISEDNSVRSRSHSVSSKRTDSGCGDRSSRNRSCSDSKVTIQNVRTISGEESIRSGNGNGKGKGLGSDTIVAEGCSHASGEQVMRGDNVSEARNRSQSERSEKSKSSSRKSEKSSSSSASEVDSELADIGRLLDLTQSMRDYEVNRVRMDLMRMMRREQQFEENLRHLLDSVTEIDTNVQEQKNVLKERIKKLMED